MNQIFKIAFVAFSLTIAVVSFFSYAFENQSVIYRERPQFERIK